MDSISDDCLLLVFSFLKLSDLCHVHLVCKRFLHICQDEKLWHLYAVSKMNILSRCKEPDALKKILQKITGPREVSWKSRVQMGHKWIQQTWNPAYSYIRMSHHKMLPDSGNFPCWLISQPEMLYSDEKFTCLACLGTDYVVVAANWYGDELVQHLALVAELEVEIQCKECKLFTFYHRGYLVSYENYIE